MSLDPADATGGGTGPTVPVPTAPTATASSSSNGLKFHPPELFDGKYEKFRPWLRDLEIFLAAYKVSDEEQKILAALTYMRGGTADEFVQEQANTALKHKPVNWGRWNDFVDDLRARFQHKNFSEEAREKLEYFRQGKHLIDEYITKLDMLFNDAVVEDDKEKIRILERGAHHNILETIYSGNDAIPATYNEYKEKVIKIGRLKERFQYLKSMQTSSWPARPAPAATPAPTPAPQRQFQFKAIAVPPPPKPETRRYEPMDVDRTKQPMHCFNCGELGHMRRDCPQVKTKLNMRAVLNNCFDDDEVAELLAEIKEQQQAAQQEDFMDGR